MNAGQVVLLRPLPPFADWPFCSPAYTGAHTGVPDVLRAKLLIMELTFLDDDVTVEEAREKGHMHIADFVANAHRFQVGSGWC